MRPNIKVSPRRVLAAAGALALATALSGCLGYDGDFDRGYQVDQQSLSQVQVGQTNKQQALALLGTLRDDPAGRVLAVRCTALLAHPPPPDWDGVYVATDK